MHSTQILVVLLIKFDWKFSSTKQKYKPDLGSGASSVWNSALISGLDVMLRGNQ